MSNRARGSRSRNEGYSNIPPTRVPRSAFDLSYSHKTTCQPSLCIPIWKQEVMPGDTISWRPSVMIRMTSNVYPYLDGIRAELQSFFVPARIVWDNWSKMHGEQLSPDDHTDYTVPQLPTPAGGHQVGSMADYMGVPTEVDNLEVSALWFRAANLCFNEWYRDENLTDPLPVPLDDGPDDPADYATPFPRLKTKDRFAGSLPFAQKGAAVSLPLGDSAPVVSSGEVITHSWNNTGNDNSFISYGSNGYQSATPWPSDNVLYAGGQTGYMTDLSAATAATIQEIRTAVSLQQMFERDARGGTRYEEGILSHFGVQMRAAIYRPELLSVGSVDVLPTEVPQTSPTDIAPDVTPQGTLAAFAKGAGVSRGFTKSFDEWGFCLAFLTVRSEVSYSQGIPADMLRKTRVDHFLPDLALLGEEAIPSKEIFADGTASDDNVWGFTPRYESYRHRVNHISGEFRSNIAGDQLRLDQWHFGIDFASRPVLNDAFIQDDPNPILRNLAASLSPPFLVDSYHKVTAVRPMPKFAVPGLLRF